MGNKLLWKIRFSKVKFSLRTPRRKVREWRYRSTNSFNFRPRAPVPSLLENEPQYPLNKRLGGSQSQLGSFGEERNVSHLKDLNKLRGRWKQRREIIRRHWNTRSCRDNERPRGGLREIIIVRSAVRRQLSGRSRRDNSKSGRPWEGFFMSHPLLIGQISRSSCRTFTFVRFSVATPHNPLSDATCVQMPSFVHWNLHLCKNERRNREEMEERGEKVRT